MIRAVEQRDFHVHDLVARKHAGLHRALDALIHTGDKLFRDRTAGDLVDELVALAGFVGFHHELDVCKLAFAAGLARVARVHRSGLGDGLLVGNLRSADIRLDAELAQKAIDDDLQMELAHAGDDGLARFLVRVGLEGGVFLGKLAEEDPTFKAYTDEETGQTIIAGMGELHLEIIVDRLLREFRVEANVGRPQVSYKETVTKAATVDTRYARQTGGKGQFAHVKLMVEPNEPGKGYEFINQITGGAIPKEFIPCVDQGIQGAMQAGVLAGYEVVDVKVTLLDGSYHEVDSSEMAFKICGSMAFKEACQKAGPTLLEPIMKVVVTAPESYMGDVMGDINARRGQIAGTDIRNGAAIVTANVPLASMFGYATDLRSKTQGRATYSMEPSHFVELPKSLQEKIIHGSN